MNFLHNQQYFQKNNHLFFLHGWMYSFICVLFFSLLLIFILTPPLLASTNDVVVFILDTQIDFKFVEKQLVDADGIISHGSIVARIIHQEAPGVELKSFPVEDEDHFLIEELYLAGLKNILDYKRKHPQKRVLVNISLAFQNPNPRHKDLIAKLDQSGVMIIAAAGNDHTEDLVYPAGFADHVVTVANASADGMDSTSSYGSHVDLSAPGSVEYVGQIYFPGQLWQKRLKALGTSFSAPRVTGLLALILEYKPDYSPQDALQLIKKNAGFIPDPRFIQKKLGVGVIDKVKTLQSIDSLYLVKKRLPYFIGGLIALVLGTGIYYRYGLKTLLLILFCSLVVLPLTFVFVYTIIDIIKAIGQWDLQWQDVLVLIISFGAGIVVTQFDWWVYLLSYGLLGGFLWGFHLDVKEATIAYQALSVGLIIWEQLSLRLVKESPNKFESLIRFWILPSKRVEKRLMNRLTELDTDILSPTRTIALETKWRRKQIFLLKLLGNLGLQEGVGILKGHLKNHPLSVRKAAFNNLLKLPAPPVNELVSAFPLTRSVQSKLEIEFLNKGEILIPQLFQLLQGSNVQKKEFATQLLILIGAPEVIQTATRSLSKGGEWDRTYLLEILAGYGPNAQMAIPEIVPIILQDQDMWIRYKALVALAAVHPQREELLPLLEKLEQDPQELVRVEAQGLIQEISHL